MNTEISLAQKVEVGVGPNARLLMSGFGSLSGFLTTAQDIEATLANLVAVADPEPAKQAAQLQSRLKAFEPSVTMIGQIKAGKTSLVNAMVGSPDLLPADINPWTSVVTSLHINKDKTQDDVETKASFKFFEAEEWDRLVDNGGRMGELASRAGADDELEKVRRQIEDMRDKSKKRLGKKFEMLLGQEHNYGYFDDDLIQRYVCMGDDLDDDASTEMQGRFADITKSADLFLNRSDIPIPLCIRDTPGVNDTFMMRERITISAIRDSRICVVVLSAHQALTSTDMALIRLISNVESRQAVIFVNRIDELSDPVAQIPEIHNSIQDTLKKSGASADIQIIFGSAYWANNALSGTLNELAPDSAKAMFDWAEEILDSSDAPDTPEETAWVLSGLPQLFNALSDRIIEGPASEVLTDVKGRALNLVHGMRASNQHISMTVEGDAISPIDKDRVEAELRRIEQKSVMSLDNAMVRLTEDFGNRVDRSHHRFLDRATESLIAHLEEKGESDVWQYNPMGLRVLLRSNYLVFGKQITTLIEKVYSETAAEFAAIYTDVCAVSVDGFQIEPPSPPNIPPPVALGQTIALDLNGGWWRNWWQRRRGYANFAEQFYKLIEAETNPIVDELKIAQVATIENNARAALLEFQADQRRALMAVADKANLGADDLQELFGITSQEERKKVVDAAFIELSEQAA